MGSLLSLPAELHAIIFAYVTSLDDAVCLTVSHRILAPEGYRRVAELRREDCAHWGSWAGERIITAGDYTDELPEELLTPGEEAEMVMEGARFYNFGYHHYQYHLPLTRRTCDVSTHVDLAAKGLRSEVVMQRVPLSEASGDYLRAHLLLESTSPRYASHGTWALCNMSCKTYVRANALATLELPGDRQTGCLVEGPFVKGKNTVVDLGTLAIIMTSWSGDVGDVGTIGPWAGDRLSIAPVEELEGEGWDDVTRMGLTAAKKCVVANEGPLGP